MSVDDLLRAYAELSEDQQAAMHAAWHKSRGGVLFAAKDPKWSSAVTSLIKAAHASGRLRELGRIRDQIHEISRGPALFPTIDAASALALRDQLKTSEFDILYGPWKAVVDD